MFKIVILIPALNEYHSLRKILHQISDEFTILIMDDNSEDNTIDLKKEFKNINYIRNNNRLGYEKNIIKGFKILINKNYNYILTMDADGEHSINNIYKIINFLKKNNVDLIVGERSNLNRFTEKILSFFFYKKFKIIDPISGMKAYKTSSLKKIINKIKKDDFLVDVVYLFIKNNLKVKNIKISTKKIKNRVSRVGSFLNSNFKILKILVKYSFR